MIYKDFTKRNKTKLVCRMEFSLVPNIYFQRKDQQFARLLQTDLLLI